MLIARRDELNFKNIIHFLGFSDTCLVLRQAFKILLVIDMAR
jgi:hypothetical protein